VPQVHDLFASSPAASTEHGTAASAISPIQPGSRDVIHVPETFRISKLEPKHAQTSIAGDSARSHPVHHSVAHDSDSAPSNSSASASSGSSSSSNTSNS